MPESREKRIVVGICIAKQVYYFHSLIYIFVRVLATRQPRKTMNFNRKLAMVALAAIVPVFAILYMIPSKGPSDSAIKSIIVEKEIQTYNTIRGMTGLFGRNQPNPEADQIAQNLHRYISVKTFGRRSVGDDVFEVDAEVTMAIPNRQREIQRATLTFRKFGDDWVLQRTRRLR